MCGICGAVGVGARETVEEMAACLAHRGPDSTGIYADDDALLANQRLSIIDVAGGDQPVYNEDGDVVVVYNGEVYNFRALRADLEAAGHTFTTGTDTEVLVHGYEEYGTGLFGRLNGMFAVALWDASNEMLVLARDRAGIKPLYYAPVEGGLLFASEPKSILQSEHVAPAVDREALRYFLQLRYSPSRTTLFAGIETLLPGQYAVVSRDDKGWQCRTHTYWRVADAVGAPPSDPAAAVEDALESAVERQLMSDVPVGFYLSGGLDTSSVVAMAAEASDEPLETFCMGFADQEWDERADARAVADHFGTTHHEITLDGDFVRDFPEMIWHADEPKRNLYPYYVAQEMSEHVSVALGGLGADELFGGYVYRYDRLAELESLRETGIGADSALRSAARDVADWQVTHGDLVDDGRLEATSLLAHVDDPARLYVLLNSTDVFADVEVFDERVFGDALAGGDSPADRIRERLGDPGDASLRELALRWDFAVKLPDDFLLVEDRMSMAHSLESRVPFLDNGLVDLAFSLPLSEKFGPTDGTDSAGKRVLRDAMRDRLPSAVFEKDKQGFTMPTYPFVRDELLAHARCILDDPHVVREGLVQRSYLTDLLGRDPTPELTPHYKLLWKLVALEVWYQMYVVDGAAGPRAIEHYYT